MPGLAAHTLSLKPIFRIQTHSTLKLYSTKSFLIIFHYVEEGVAIPLFLVKLLYYFTSEIHH